MKKSKEKKCQKSKKSKEIIWPKMKKSKEIISGTPSFGKSLVAV